MERRIRIVWIFSIAAMLLITCGQAYWLRNQYQYVNEEQMNAAYHDILHTAQQYDSIRSSRFEEAFTRKNLFFYRLAKSIDLENRNTVDELLLGVLKSRQLADAKAGKEGESTDSFDLEEPEYRDRVLVEDSFRIKTSDREAVNLNAVVHQYRLELDAPFSLQAFDSLLALRIDKPLFTTRLLASEDSAYRWQAELNRRGGWLHPFVEVSYPYNPLKRKSLLVNVKIPPHRALVEMGWQLFGSICLIFLLGLCLLFQIKIILKQRKIDELRKNFVNTMIHELKRPVQALKMCIAFLNDKSMRTDEKAMDEVIHDSISELDNLSAYLSKLRDMTRADEEHTQLSVRTFDIKACVEKLIRLHHTPEGKEVCMETRFSADTLVTADPVHISNIIGNLVENAVKYSGRSVRIGVECRLQEGRLMIRVTDNGIGIPAAEQSRVFDKFYRGSNLPDRSLPGIGLGLSYVKLLVEAHRGSICLSSRSGVGTTVEIDIPQ